MFDQDYRASTLNMFLFDALLDDNTCTSAFLVVWDALVAPQLRPHPHLKHSTETGKKQSNKNHFELILLIYTCNISGSNY